MPKLAIAVVALVSACHMGSQTSTDAGPANTIDVNAYPLRLNPSANGHVLVMGGAEGCHNVSADVDLYALMAAINNSEPTSCELLSDPVWQTCRFGEVYAKADKSDCICRVGGKEPKTMACPKPTAN
jgi:hypothetical protein